jgi:hypothetical protein
MKKNARGKKAFQQIFIKKYSLFEKNTITLTFCTKAAGYHSVFYCKNTQHFQSVTVIKTHFGLTFFQKKV